MATDSTKEEQREVLENNNITDIRQKTTIPIPSIHHDNSNNHNRLDEIREKILKLEKRFSYRIPGQHYYHGIMWSSLAPIERLQELESFEVKHDDVIVTGYPKSGTTWLEEIIFLILNDGDITKSNELPVYMRVPYLEGRWDGAMINTMLPPRIYKSHLPYDLLPKQIDEKRPKMVHIIRDPRDTAVSYYHFYKALTELGRYTGTWDAFLDMFMAGFVCCGDWFQYVQKWWSHRNEPNILIVRYENMKQNPEKNIQNIAEFLGKSLEASILTEIEKHTQFESMKNNPMVNFTGVPNIDETISPFMRKGEVGDWTNYFTSTQTQGFDALMSDKLAQIEDLHY